MKDIWMNLAWASLPIFAFLANLIHHIRTRRTTGRLFWEHAFPVGGMLGAISQAFFAVVIISLVAGFFLPVARDANLILLTVWLTFSNVAAIIQRRNTQATAGRKVPPSAGASGGQ